MYMAYGSPQVLPLDPDPDPGAGLTVLLRVSGRLLLLVAPSSLHLFSSSHHKIRLARHLRDPADLAAHGHNLHAAWSPDTKTVAVLTSSSFIHIYKLHMSGKRLLIGGKLNAGLSLATISLVITEKASFSDQNLTVSNFVCDSKNILMGLSNGQLQLVSWNAEFSGMFKLSCHQCCENSVADLHPVLNVSSSFQGDSHSCAKASAVVHLELSLQLRLLVALYSDGQVALCSISKKGLKHSGSIKAERWLKIDDAVCASVASDQQFLAVGCSRGVVELYDLADNASHLRTVSLYDWGYFMEDTGPVTCIAWTPDNCAFAVGWKFRGLTVWSVSGCRLMCTIRQIGMNSASSPRVKPNQDLKFEPLMGGTSLVQWDEYGYKLYAVEEGSSERILAFSFGKCCLNRGLSGSTYARQIIYGEDRVLLVQPDDTEELKIVHLNLPVSYISQNWPVLHVVASKDGTEN